LGFWLLLIGLQFLNLGPAQAEWVALDRRFQTPEVQTSYFDPQSISRDNHLASLWDLTDIKWADGALTPKFLSAKTHKQFDCARVRFRILEIVQFSRQMATGKSWNGYIENGNWQPVQSQTVNHALWETACHKQ
jgi:hypothetical protein